MFGRMLLIGIGILATSARADIAWVNGCAPRTHDLRITEFGKRSVSRYLVMSDAVLTVDKVFAMEDGDMVIVNGVVPSATADGYSREDYCAVAHYIDDLARQNALQENRPTVLDEDQVFGVPSRERWLKIFRTPSGARAAFETELRAVGAESAGAKLTQFTAEAGAIKATVRLCQRRTSWLPVRRTWNAACYEYKFAYRAPSRLEISRDTWGGHGQATVEAGSRALVKK